MAVDPAYEPGWLNDQQVAAAGMCATFHGVQACDCTPETCRAIGFSSLATAAVGALHAKHRLLRPYIAKGREPYV